MAETPRDEIRKLMRAYAGFQMATALVVSAKASEVRWAGLIVSLFAVSIPSTVAYAGFARITPEDAKRNPASMMAVSFCLAFLPSIAGVSLLLAAASTFAAIAFPITCAAWFTVIVVARQRDHIKPPRHDA